MKDQKLMIDPLPTPDHACALQALAITKRFGGVTAVNAVSFEVEAGAITGLIGPNGAGKTTLFDILAGDQTSDSGEIQLSGQSVTGERADQRLALGLGRTFQIPRPFAAMTVVENVMLGRQYQAGEQIWPNIIAPGRVARQERESHERAMTLLEFLTLAPLADKPAAVLSGGQKKLLELGRILMAEPTVILLDEPAAGVNPALLEIIMERIHILNAQGITFFIIEHNMDLVARLCRNVIVMASGEIILEGTPQSVIQDPRVIDAYLGGGMP